LAGANKKISGSAACVGLDIGSFSAKVVQLSPSPSGLRIKQRVIQLFSPSANSRTKGQAVRSLIDSLGVGRETRIVTGIGGTGTVVRSVTLPEMSEKDLKAALLFEAEKYIPFKLEETYFDSSILGKRPGGRMEVLLAAARREVVNSHLEILNEAAVHADVLDLEALALANAWENRGGAEEAKMTCLMHVGARGTVLDFFEGKRLQFTREIPIGGDAFTQAVSEGFQTDLAEAEKIKCEPGGQESRVRTALEPAWDEWLAQCRVSFDFFENQFGHKVERLALSGGSAPLVGFKEKILQSTGLPTDEWDALAGLGEESGNGAGSGAVFAVAVGLALRGASR
jgi:type IV pilus assembly protein PilM